MHTKFNPSSMAAPVQNLYAQVTISAPGARMAFISGQVALDQSGALIGENDHAAQARQCFVNIQNAVKALGADPADIAQMRIYVVAHEPGLTPVIFGAGGDVFGAEWPLCASTLVGVAALGLPQWLIEIEAIVTLPASWQPAEAGVE